MGTGGNKKRGKKEGENGTIEDNKIIDIRNYKPKRIPQLMWRECVKKVWEVDPLVCPKCTGEMKIISFIYKKAVIKKILIHLNLYEERGNQRAPPTRRVGNIERIKVEPYDDGWPKYDEPVFDF
ncbi:MAG: hypothetical protein GY702_18305 [Desulfobulbaceae bacterium]|nr:hypothetical protein [Desulfobulbaceae bacterium]